MTIAMKTQKFNNAINLQLETISRQRAPETPDEIDEYIEQYEPDTLTIMERHDMSIRDEETVEQLVQACKDLSNIKSWIASCLDREKCGEFKAFAYVESSNLLARLQAFLVDKHKINVDAGH